MIGDNLRDLHAFLAVAQEGSFTRAAGRLGVSQSALSQGIGALEERLGIRLFSRTTRSVALTEAGDRLLGFIGPALQEIDCGLAQLNELREKPIGTIRITADEFAIQSVLWPALQRVLPKFPEIKVEITMDYGLTDIVGGRYDAGVRRGRLVAQDMIAVPIGPAIRMAVAGAASYFERRPQPKRPQDLINHPCINLRLPTHGSFFAWTFSKGNKEQRVKVDGQLVFSSITPVLDAALAGFGLAYLPEEQLRPHISAGRLVEVLADWRQTFEGYHLYYPNRRHQTPALSILVDALRYRG